MDKNEYLDYCKMIDSYQKIDLTKEEKKTLEAFDNDIAKKLINDTLTSLTKKMLTWEISSDFLKGATFSLNKFSKYFKD